MTSPLMLPVEDDPFNFARYADPYPNYRRVRETTPVYWSQLLGGWVLTRHADVKAALVDKRLSAARTRVTPISGASAPRIPAWPSAAWRMTPAGGRRTAASDGPAWLTASLCCKKAGP